ncbi:MAG: copper chaperone PCu(A)C [Paracoccaceae bacterium]
MTFLHTAALAATLALSATAALAHDGVHIDDPYARFLPGAKSGAAFFVIENHATVDDRLVAVTADVAEKSELHTHKMDASGMMQMGPIEGGIVIPAGESHALERGGDHVMMMMLTRVPKEGEVIGLTLTFEHAGAVTVEVPVDNHR